MQHKLSVEKFNNFFIWLYVLFFFSLSLFLWISMFLCLSLSDLSVCLSLANKFVKFFSSCPLFCFLFNLALQYVYIKWERNCPIICLFLNISLKLHLNIRFSFTLIIVWTIEMIYASTVFCIVVVIAIVLTTTTVTVDPPTPLYQGTHTHERIKRNEM